MELDQRDEQLCETIRSYFRRRKFQELHRKILDGSIEVSSEGEDEALKPQVLEVYRKCLSELTFSQALTVFSFFVDQDVFKNSIALQLLPTFLLHLKINDHVVADIAQRQFETCVQKLEEYLLNIRKWKKLDDAVLCRILQVVYALGNIKAFEVFYDDRRWDTDFSDSPYNIANFYGEKFQDLGSILVEKVNHSTSEKLIAIIVKLWAQKCLLLSKTVSHDGEESGGHHVVVSLVEAIISLLSGNSSMIWETPFEALMPLLNQDQVSTLVEVVLSETKEDIDFRGNARCFLSPTFQQSDIVQTSLVHHICQSLIPLLPAARGNVENLKEKYWHRYCRTTLKANPTNKVWTHLKHEAEVVKTVEPGPYEKNELTLNTSLSKLLSLVPLGSLFATNQTRTLLMLCSFIFGCHFSCVDLKKTIIKCFTIISGGSRGFWLFDLIGPSLFLKRLVNFAEDDAESETALLVSLVLDRLFRLPDIGDNLKGIQEMFSSIKEPSKMEFFVQVETLDRIVSRAGHRRSPYEVDTLLKSVARIVRKKSKNLSKAGVDIKLVVKACHLLIKHRLTHDTSDFSINGFEEILKFSLLDHEEEDRDLKECRLSFLAYVLSERTALSEILPENVWEIYAQTLDKEQRKNVSVDESGSSAEISSKSTKRKNREETKDEERELIKRAKQSFSFENSDVHIAFFESCPKDEFESMVGKLLLKLSTDEPLMWRNSLSMWNCIMRCRWFKASPVDEKASVVVNHLDELLCRLVKIVHVTNAKPGAVYDMDLVALAFQVLAATLHNCQAAFTFNKVSLCLQACALISFGNKTQSTEYFMSNFKSIYAVVSEILLRHKIAATFAVSTINGLAAIMLSNLMKICKQDAYVNYCDDVKKSLQLCGNEFERLAVGLASLDEDYIPHAPHLIAVYVTEVQNITVHDEVKHNIVLGLYRLFNVIKTNSRFDFIHSRLNQSGREVFKLLYNNYEKYFKYKGDV